MQGGGEESGGLPETKEEYLLALHFFPEEVSQCCRGMPPRMGDQAIFTATTQMASAPLAPRQVQSS